MGLHADAATAYERILDKLEGVKRTGVKATARCPAHEDSVASLSLKAIEGRVLVYCFAGCHTEDVVTAIGWKMGDLYDDHKGATYEYADGVKAKRWYDRDGKKHFNQTGHISNTNTVLFRLETVKMAVAAGNTVWMVEGEDDVRALESIGLIATSARGGTSSLHKADLTPLHGGHIIAVVDNDDAGHKWAQQLWAMIGGKTSSLRFVKAAINRPKSDASDHIAAGYGVDDFISWDITPEPEPEADPELSEPRTWRPVDLTTVLDGTWKPPEPTVGMRDDGKGLLYPGKCHTVTSETEGGKTWFALCIALDEMHAGNHVLYIDFEDDEGGVVGRLLTLGAKRETIAQHFHYLRPESPLGSGIHFDDLRETVLTYHPTLDIIDGITEAMTVHGLDPLNNKEAALFGHILPRKLARAGAAVASLDHVVKDKEGRGRYAIGAVHKLNALDGAAYTLENRNPFGIGITGRSTIRIAKDRPGQLRKNALPSDMLHWYGDLVLKSEGEEFAEISITPPHEKDENFRPTIYMDRVAQAITKHGSIPSKNSLEKAVSGRAETVRSALEYLILDGYVTPRAPYTLIKPYTP